MAFRGNEVAEARFGLIAHDPVPAAAVEPSRPRLHMAGLRTSLRHRIGLLVACFWRLPLPPAARR